MTGLASDAADTITDPAWACEVAAIDVALLAIERRVIGLAHLTVVPASLLAEILDTRTRLNALLLLARLARTPATVH